MVCFVCTSIFMVAENGQSSRKGRAGQTYGELPSSVFGLSLLTANICHIASESYSIPAAYGETSIQLHIHVEL